MATHHQRALRQLQRLRELRGGEPPRPPALPSEEEVSPRVANSPRIDPQAVHRRWNLLPASGAQQVLLDEQTQREMAVYARHIENFLGTVKIPVGLAGPLRVRGLFANGDFYLPLATTEAALVASYTRGCQAISDAGGCTSVVINEGVTRSPVFIFNDVVEAGQFVVWIAEQIESIRQAAEATTRHGSLADLRLALEGNRAFLLLDFLTGDAAGQNMVTIATEAVCRHILAASPIAPRQWFVEGNMSGDKKAAVQSFQGVRGKKVIAEVILPAELVERRLRATPALMVAYYQASAMGAVLSGTIGIQGHYANGLAALFLACGQDVACVAESAVGVTRIEQREDGAIYASVTLPNLIVGTVGGGTGLPSAKACLDLLGLSGPGKSGAFAEVCAALLLAGELSINAAMAAGQFTRAHQKLARPKDA